MSKHLQNHMFPVCFLIFLHGLQGFLVDFGAISEGFLDFGGFCRICKGFEDLRWFCFHMEGFKNIWLILLAYARVLRILLAFVIIRNGFTDVG